MIRLRTPALISYAVAVACAGTPATPTNPTAEPELPPATDIYVYRLSRSVLPFRQRLFNITNRKGYDNQPYFVGSTIYYTSQRGGQADIYKYEDGRTVPVISTPESEYSPALTPDGNAISVVRVERDSTQRLWRFPLAGGAPSLILRDVKPVGYYAWLDSTTVALFALGNPNTLQIADTRTGLAKVVTANIGRSLQRVPGGRRVSFVQRADGRWVLKTADPVPRANDVWDIETVAALPDSAEYVVWKSPTEIYTAVGSKLFHLRRPRTTWDELADLAPYGLRHISRLALHPNGSELAIVADDAR